jgi:hypothetical protein
VTGEAVGPDYWREVAIDKPDQSDVEQLGLSNYSVGPIQGIL